MESAPATWNTYIWVDSADETAAKVREAGGQRAQRADRHLRLRPDGVDRRPRGRRCSASGSRTSTAARAVVNEPGSLNFNGLHTRDLEGAKAFYGAVFGWDALPMGMWALRPYGDHLEALNPGTRARTKEFGGPDRFEEVVAAVTEITDDTPPHWDVTFGVADADAIAARATELGGTVLVPPFDAPWIRGTVIRDPQGATFNANQFVPENKDIGAPADSQLRRHERPLRGRGQPLDDASSGRPRPV